MKIIVMLILVIFATISLAYTPPDNQEVALILDASYTPYDNENIVLVLGEAGGGGSTCDCPSINTNWMINDGSICVPTSNCDIGTGIIRINKGGLRVNNGIKVDAAGCFKNDSQILFVADGGGLNCGT